MGRVVREYRAGNIVAPIVHAREGGIGGDAELGDEPGEDAVQWASVVVSARGKGVEAVGAVGRQGAVGAEGDVPGGGVEGVVAPRGARMDATGSDAGVAQRGAGTRGRAGHAVGSSEGEGDMVGTLREADLPSGTADPKRLEPSSGGGARRARESTRGVGRSVGTSLGRRCARRASGSGAFGGCASRRCVTRRDARATPRALSSTQRTTRRSGVVSGTGDR